MNGFRQIFYTKASQDPCLKVTGSRYDRAGCDGGLSEVRKEVDLMRDNDKQEGRGGEDPRT